MNWELPPDYPNLLPEMFARPPCSRPLRCPGPDAGGRRLFALLLAAARGGLRQGTADRFTRHAGLALVALAVGAFGIGYRMAAGRTG